ncbi:MAG TPA: thiamine phosphate synthase [Hyphomicrobiales bacterium]|nr:thiamine phosphate synthase [Hyphomicrobiales bacterium]
MARRFDPSVYLVTDGRLCAARGVVETVRAAIDGGVTAVQLRDPSVPARVLVATAKALVALLRPRGIPLIVNDRADVALAADADGVHLGQDDLAPRHARRLLGPGRIIGLSVGSPAEFAASADQLPFVDYLGTGPLRVTTTKADAGAAIGIEGLVAVRTLTTLPLVAIGGVDAALAAEAAAAGADGVAVVSAICGAPDPAAAAAAIAAAFREAQ